MNNVNIKKIIDYSYHEYLNSNCFLQYQFLLDQSTFAGQYLKWLLLQVEGQSLGFHASLPLKLQRRVARAERPLTSPEQYQLCSTFGLIVFM
jgi:hypothetical protein